MKTSEFFLNHAHNKVQIIMIYYAFSQKLCNILLKDTKFNKNQKFWCFVEKFTTIFVFDETFKAVSYLPLSF